METIKKVVTGLGVVAAWVVAVVLATVFAHGNLKGLGDAAILDALSEEPR